MITYIHGDATYPIGEGNKVIIHCNNDIKRWGKGFVCAISKRWKKPETQYKFHQEMKLGTVDFVQVEDDIWIGNMIGQHTIWNQNGIPPIRYGAIRKCLKHVHEWCVKNNATVHCPKFGAGLAGGKWEEIEKIINEELSDISVTVYLY